ncbi:tail fiber assembly protein [Aeromonas sp. R9-1]|uniref:tail fiber assembly protein n=1 Tax=Aeromonas sp. R9-1 TaxID=3138478 RepID=UPI0034A486AD
MNVEIVSAKNPRAMADEPNAIILDVLFSHLTTHVEFSACKDDPEVHGRELYHRAVFGEFGNIDEIPTPLPSEASQQQRLDRLMAAASLRIAPLQDAKELGIATDAELTRLETEQRYRIELMRLPQSEGWPTQVTWPEAPQ